MISPDICRWIVRNWMMQRGRMGRSKAKRLLRRALHDAQKVEILPGLFMQLDLRWMIQEHIFWFYEEMEPALQWAIRTLLPVGGTFCDVGANVGLLGLLAMHQRNARGIFVEPHPRLADSIRTNILLNGFTKKAHVLEWAASNSDGEGELTFDRLTDGGHSLENVPYPSTSCTVSKRPLADFLRGTDISFVDILKSDTEGHDWKVLDGLADFLIPSYIGMIFVEMEHCDSFSHAIWKLLLERDYRPFAAMTIYIDELRRLARKEEQGHRITFFRPISAPGGLNILWCEREGRVEEFLYKVHEMAINR